MTELHLDIVTPEGVVTEQDVAMVEVPGVSGNLGALPGHVPTVTALRPGMVTVYDKARSSQKKWFVHGGFAEITSEKCVVLAEFAESSEKITQERVSQQQAKADEALKNATTDAEKNHANREQAVADAMGKVVA